MRTLTPADYRRLHLTLTVVWLGLVAPTALWWHDSVLWVALMSAYANAVNHFSAYQAARAEGSALWCRIHAAATAAWLALIWPTVAWWHDSVLWVGLMSAYAISVGHLSAWQGCRAEAATP